MPTENVKVIVLIDNLVFILQTNIRGKWEKKSTIKSTLDITS